MLATGKSSVLVVDDADDIVIIISRMLKNQGLDVHSFTDPAKALSHLTEENCTSCGILVSDIRMPGMSGIDLAKEVKKLRPEMKIILMTAFEQYQKEWQNDLPSIHVEAILTKPVRLSELVSQIKIHVT